MKKNLLGSFLSFSFIVSMFVSSTHAWFSEYSNIIGNRVESGNLAVDFHTSNEISNGDLSGSILNIKNSNDPLFVFSEATRQNDYIEKFIRVKNQGSVPINYQVIFNTTETSIIENYIEFEIEFLGNQVQTIAASEIDYNNIITLQDVSPVGGGLLNKGFEIWRIKMIVNPNFDEEVNIDGLNFSFDLKFRAWHFNYPLSSILNTIDIYENNGTSKKQAFYTINETISLRTPFKRGYHFVGWFDHSLTIPFTLTKMPNQNIEVFAKWLPVEYSINYNLNNGIFLENPRSFYTVLDSFNLIEPTRQGYTFSGWFTSDIFLSETSFLSVETGTIGVLNLFAKWSINQYTLTFDSNGGLDSASITQSFNSDINYPLVTRHGFNFEGWYTEKTYQNRFELTTIPSRNEVLYARWLPKNLVRIETSEHKNFGYTEDGAIFAWGQNTANYISGVNSNLSIPTYLPIQRYLGEEFTINFFTKYNNFFLTDKKEIFKFVYNSISRVNLDLAPFNYYSNSIKKISDTSSNLYVLFDEGRLFEVKLSDSTIKEISITSLMSDEKIIDIVNSRNHTLLLTSAGNVYGFGSNNNGQVGIGGQYTPSMSTISTPSKLNLSNIVSISANINNGFAINDNGELFGWGGFSASGRGYNFGNNFWTPGKLIFPNFQLNEKVISVSNNSSHGLATTNFGNVFSWGETGSKLAIGYDGNSYYSPRKINFDNLNEEKVVLVSAGSSYSLFLTDKGRIFTAGSSDFGALGTGGTNNHFYPVLANPPQE